MDRRKIYEALGSAAATFITGMAVYKGVSEIATMGLGNAIYQPFIQGILVGLSTLGFRSIPSRRGAGE